MARTHSGFMIQGTYGARGNFELVLPAADGGLTHWVRLNDHPLLLWCGPYAFGEAQAQVDAVSLIQSSLGSDGRNLEVVARVGERLAYYYREDQSPSSWVGPIYFASGVSPHASVAGNPAFVQGPFGAQGNFELVVPLATGGLAHYWCNNDQEGRPWSKSVVFGTSVGQIDAVALIQSSYDHNLEVVARVGQQLLHFWRDSSPSVAWHGPTVIFSGATGLPALIQNKNGPPGNFELVVPLLSGGMAHLWRDNGGDGLWRLSAQFGEGQVSEVALIQSNFGPQEGNLEVAARIGNCTQHFYRENNQWHQGALVCDKPAPNPLTHGTWQVPYQPEPKVTGIHAALLHTGKVLLFTYNESNHDLGDSIVLDPISRLSTPQPTLNQDRFCAGLTPLADGRLLTAGGHQAGVRALYTFTPDGAGAGNWDYVGDMSDDRWYPTCTTLPDGRVFIISGTKEGGGPDKPLNDTYEIFDPQIGALPPQPAAFLKPLDPYALYPFVYVLPEGKLLMHANNETRFIDLSTWEYEPTVLKAIRADPRTYELQGTSVLLPLSPTSNPPYHAKVMLIGGGALPPAPNSPATNTCEILDLSASPLAWQAAPAMSQPRVMPDAVLLPDGTVLVMNGSKAGKADHAIQPVLDVELYDPTSNSWSQLSPMCIPRLYHSSAILLPDGRVLTAGKDKDFNPDPYHYHEYHIELFSPPYLFKGKRPHLTMAPSQLTYNLTFHVETPDYAEVTKAALLYPSAVTHSNNMSQRYVELTIKERSNGHLTLQAPPNGYVAPPGYYMLFLLNKIGVPSVGQFVRLG